MNVTIGALLSAIAGGLAGALDARIRHASPPRRALVVGALLGALLGTCSYAVFLVAGLVVGLLTFSSAPDPLPALLCVLIGCAAFLLLRWLERLIGPRFGLPAPRHPSGRRDLRDLLDARPRGGAATMWLGGIGLALLPAFYGLRCIVTRKGDIGTVMWRSTVEGGPAIALGIGWIGIGAFLCFHFFFGLHPRLGAHSRPGKTASLIVACAGLSVAGAWSVISRVP